MNLVVNSTLTHCQVVNPKASKTVLILPGWNQHSLHWSPLVSLLPSTYRYLILDLPGFGQTHHLPDQPGIPEYTSFVLAFLKKLGLKKTTLLGHSFGGQIAMSLAASPSHLLSNLLLLSPAGIRIKTHKQKVKKFLYRRFRYFKIFLPQPILKKVISLFTSTDYLNASPKHRQILKKIISQDLTPLLPQITLPTHILWGDQDQEIPYLGKFLASHLPNARLTVLYGAGHNPQLLQKEVLASTLTNILKNDHY